MGLFDFSSVTRPQAAANYFFWLARWFFWQLAVASQVFSMAGWLETNMAG